MDWTAYFKEHPELEPPGYWEAVEAAKEVTKQRYAIHGQKRAKGNNSRKPKIESRAATRERERKKQQN